MYKIAFVYVYYTYYFFGKLILNSVVWMVFRFFEHHPTIFDYSTQKQENYAIVQSKILSAIFNSPTWLKGHFSESLWCYLSYLVRFLISTRNWQCHKGKHFHFLVKFYLKIKKWKCCPLWNCQFPVDIERGKEGEGKHHKDSENDPWGHVGLFKMADF